MTQAVKGGAMHEYSAIEACAVCIAIRAAIMTRPELCVATHHNARAPSGTRILAGADVKREMLSVLETGGSETGAPFWRAIRTRLYEAGDAGGNGPMVAMATARAKRL